MKVKYAGVANNAVRAAFQSAGFRRTSKPQWNVLWSKALKPEAYSGLTKFQRVCMALCMLSGALIKGCSIATKPSWMCKAFHML